MVRWWRMALLVLAGVVATAAGTVLAVAVNVATGGTAKPRSTGEVGVFRACQRERCPLTWDNGSY